MWKPKKEGEPYWESPWGPVSYTHLIPYEKGLLGHSDADVLLHAIMDALLGAAALGDIGKHFPDTDDKYKGISSIKLLEHVGELLEKHNYQIVNLGNVYQYLPVQQDVYKRQGCDQ